MSLTLLRVLPRRSFQQRGTCALIAIKQRVRCKTRLSETLTPAARLQLVRSMLAAVLSAAGAARTVRQIVVVSPERDTVPADVPVIVDTGEDLNSALTEAHRVLLEFGWREVVILPADLPTISAADIDGLAHAARIGGFAIAPDTAGSGTNALCLVSAQAFRFQFGLGSQRLHLREAQRMGLSPQVVCFPGLQFDVDSPADLSRLDGQPWAARRRA
jgi:2-phospho-L-lactate guanylyltransferase